MADFFKAHAVTLGHEQFPGYVNDVVDKGGETCAGITRRDHPTWPGWDVVDTVRKGLGSVANAKRINAGLLRYPGLPALVEALYRAEYWEPLGLDAEPSQAVAEKTYDIAVNMGVGTARKFLAEARA